MDWNIFCSIVSVCRGFEQMYSGQYFSRNYVSPFLSKQGIGWMEFTYRASTLEGRVHQGRIDASDKKQAAASLHARNLIPLSIEPLDRQAINSEFRSQNRIKYAWLYLHSLDAFARGKIGTKDLTAFTEHLGAMLKAGITMNKSLALLGDLTENRSLARVIKDVHSRIREGSHLYQALEEHPEVFPEVFINMVRAGESGGILDVILERLSEFMNEMARLREHLVSSMIYPAILGLTAAASMLVMLVVVIPRFADIFVDMGIEMPQATRVMLWCGNFIVHYWWALGLGAVLCLLMLKYLRSTSGGRLFWDRLRMRLPLLGTIFLKLELARFSRTLGTLLNSGVSILEAMNIVSGVVGNTVLKNRLAVVYDDLKQGRMLSGSLEQHGIFPPLAVNMLRVGEESGEMAVMLEKVGDMYDRDLRRAVKSFTSIFEPAVILVMGLVIGVMVVSMLMAVFSLNEMGI